MKEKILFITEALWIGGIETALVNLLRRMDYDKYDVTCLILRGELDMADKIHPACRLLVADRHRTVSFFEPYKFSRLAHLTEKSDHPSRLHRAMMWAVPAIRWVENRLYIRYIREQMKGQHFDTCVIYSDRTAETAVRAIDADRYLLFYHHGAMRREYHDEIGYRRAEKIIAVSGHVEQKLRRFRPKYADKMMTLHNLTDVEGIRAKAEAPIPREFSENEFHIVSCGRVSREKGMDLAVEACAKLVEMGHDNIRWWIIGGGPEFQMLQNQVAACHLEDHMTLLGMQSNPYPWIRQADLYVQPSRFEAYGLTIAEAMILGKAIVSTDNGGAGELLTDGKNGRLCPIDADVIAQTIHSLLAKPDELSQLRKNVETTDMDAENRQTMASLEKIL